MRQWLAARSPLWAQRQQRGSGGAGLWQAPGRGFSVLSRNEAGETRGLGFVDPQATLPCPWRNIDHAPSRRCSIAARVPAFADEAELLSNAIVGSSTPTRINKND